MSPGSGIGIQAGSADGGVCQQRVDVVRALGPALRQQFVLHHRHHEAGVAGLLLRHSLDGRA